MRAMCPAVSGEKFAPTENAGYSACDNLEVMFIYAIVQMIFASDYYELSFSYRFLTMHTSLR
jgi:hypothetical protein